MGTNVNGTSLTRLGTVNNQCGPSFKAQKLYNGPYDPISLPVRELKRTNIRPTYTFSLSNTLGIACQVLIGDSKSEESVRMCYFGVYCSLQLTEGVEMVTIGATIREFCVIFRSRMHLFFIFICRISIILSTSARMRLLRVKIID